MAEATETTAAEAPAAEKKAPKEKGPKAPKVRVKLVGAELAAKRVLRRKLKTAGRKKRLAKLRTDQAFAKTFFEARSKRSDEKKSVFRKKKSRKK